MPQVKITKAATLSGHIGSVYAMAQDSAFPELFYSGSGDGMVIRWDAKDLRNGVVVAKVQANIFSLQIHPENNLLFIGQMQGGIHALDLKERKEIRYLAYHQKGVYDIQFDKKQKLVLTAGGDGILSAFDNSTLEIQKTIQISEKNARQLAFHPSRQLLAVGCSDNAAYILSSENFNVKHVLAQHANSVFSVCFSRDGRYLLTGSRDAQLRVWDAAHEYQLLKTIPAHLFTVNSIAYSPDGNFFATASRDKTIKIWNAATFELLKVIDKEKYDGHVNSVNKLLWISHDNLLISCSDDRSVIVWRIEASA